MVLTPAELAEYLRVIKASGLTEFHWGDWHVVFPQTFDQENVKEPGFRPSAHREVKTLWNNPSLWPGGQPPKFPSKDE